MSHGPGFGNSCLRRSVPSNRWLGSPWLLRICLGLYYIALSKEICHRQPVKGSFNPSPREWRGSTLRLCDRSLLSCTEPTGCLVGGPALWCSLQTAGGRSFRPLACDIWQSKSWSQDMYGGGRTWVLTEFCFSHSPGSLVLAEAVQCPRLNFWRDAEASAGRTQCDSVELHLLVHQDKLQQGSLNFSKLPIAKS